jgi:hypothetical protein
VTLGAIVDHALMSKRKGSGDICLNLVRPEVRGVQRGTSRTTNESGTPTSHDKKSDGWEMNC